MQILFPQNDRARVAKPPDNRSVFRRYAVLEQSAGCCGAHTGRIHDVFQSDRNSVQRPTVVSTVDFFFRTTRISESRLGQHGDKRIQLWIQMLDALQAIARQFHRRNSASANLLTQCFYGRAHLDPFCRNRFYRL